MKSVNQLVVWSSFQVDSVDKCLYSYRVIVYYRHVNTTVAETTLYGYHESIMVQLDLQSNTEFTARVDRVTAANQLNLPPISFSKALYIISQYPC